MCTVGRREFEVIGTKHAASIRIDYDPNNDPTTALKKKPGRYCTYETQPRGRLLRCWIRDDDNKHTGLVACSSAAQTRLEASARRMKAGRDGAVAAAGRDCCERAEQLNSKATQLEQAEREGRRGRSVLWPRVVHPHAARLPRRHESERGMVRLPKWSRLTDFLELSFVPVRRKSLSF